MIDDLLRRIVAEAVRTELRAVIDELRVASLPFDPVSAVSVTAAAKRLACSPAWLRGELAAGRLPGIRIGRRWAVRLPEIERSLAAQKAPEIDVEQRAREIVHGVGRRKP